MFRKLIKFPWSNKSYHRITRRYGREDGLIFPRLEQQSQKDVVLIHPAPEQITICHIKQTRDPTNLSVTETGWLQQKNQIHILRSITIGNHLPNTKNFDIIRSCQKNTIFCKAIIGEKAYNISRFLLHNITFCTYPYAAYVI